MSILRHHLFHAFKWSAAGELASRILQPLVFLILARLLTPEDFGVMAAAMMVVSFSQVFWEAGMGKALIQRQKDVIEAADSVFWINLILSVFVTAVLLFAASPIGEFVFHDDRVVAVTQTLTILIPLGALCTVQTALLQREFQYRRLFLVRLIAALVPGFASIPLALHGMGYWALVGGMLLGQLGKVITLWKMCDWRPRLRLHSALSVSLFHFGKWATMSASLGWFFMWVDILVIGYYLGPSAMGIYQVGNTFVGLMFGLVVGPIIPVIYGEFSRSQNDLDRIRKGILTVGKMLSMITFPIAVVVVLLDEFIVNTLFGEEFHEIKSILGWLVVTGVLSYTVSLYQEAYRSIGRPDIETKVMAVSIIIRIPFYLISVHFGMVAFVVARLVSTCFGIVNHQIFAARHLEVSLVDYIKMISTVLMSSISMLLVGKLIISEFNFQVATISNAVLLVVIVGATYTASLVLLDNLPLRDLWSIILRRK